MLLVVKVLIVYERKNRELETAVLLKIKLENIGIQCDLSQFYEVSYYCFFHNSNYDFVFVPHLYNDEEVFRTLARFGNKTQIINLQYEQVLSKKWEDLGHHTPSGIAQKYMHVCWGNATKERLVDAGIDDNDALLVGAMHLDLLQDSTCVKKHFKENVAKIFGLPMDKKWNLFLSSFTYADISDERLRQNEEIAKTDLSYFKHIHTSSRNEIIKWLDDVLSLDNDSILIYRPHPDESDLSKLSYLEEKYDNFFVIAYSSAKDWIQSCDLILSWYSTTVVESHLLNKPYAILRPLELSDDFDSVLLKKGRFIESLEEFRDGVYLSGNFKGKALSDDDVANYYGSVKGGAVDRLIEVLTDRNDLDKKLVKVNVPFLYVFKAFLVVIIKAIYKLESRLGIEFIKIPFFRSLFFDFKNQIASKKEIEEMARFVKFKIDN